MKNQRKSKETSACCEREEQLGVGVSQCRELDYCVSSARQLTLLSLSNITGHNGNINAVSIIRPSANGLQTAWT